MKLIQTTTADSFDLFYGLYKFNRGNADDIIENLKEATDDIVGQLQFEERVSEKLLEEQRKDSLGKKR